MKNRALSIVFISVMAFFLQFSVASVVFAEWTDTGDINSGRLVFSATLLQDGRVLVAGGQTGDGCLITDFTATAEIYDPSAGTWSATAGMASARKSHTATLLPNGKVLVAGGALCNDTVWYSIAECELYDPTTGTWSPAQSMPEARSDHTATLLPNGKVLVAGGAGYSNRTSLLYDPDTGTWSYTGDMIEIRTYGHSATLLPNGKVLVAGGDNSGGCCYSSSAEIYDPETGAWSATGSMAGGRGRHTATLLGNGKVLVSAGQSQNWTYLQTAELFDPDGNGGAGSWTITGSLSVTRRFHTATLLPNGKVLVTGGFGPHSSTEIYDPGSGTWSDAGNLRSARGGHCATLLPSGNVLLSSGSDGSSYLTSSELYVSATGSWNSSGNMTVSRHGHQAVLLPNGKVLVVGGADVTYLSSAELYDQDTGTWAAAGTMANSRNHHTATLLPDGKVLVAGGVDWSNTFSSAELYDPSGSGGNGSWTTTGNMTTERWGHSATLLPDGKVLVAGGNVADGGSLSSAELYDPVSGSWISTGSMAEALWCRTATLLPNGKVLVAGGINGKTMVISSGAELYDPRSGTWSATGNMSSPRAAHTATLLPNGKVLVAGGKDVAGFLASAELYDPVAGTWSFTGSMSTARPVHGAVLLTSGKVLVVGGGDYNNGGLALKDAEIYDPGSGSWRSTTSSMSTARWDFTLTLLPSGRALAAGGYGTSNSWLQNTELYDPGLGYDAAWRPVVSTATSPLCHGDPLKVEGSRFKGISEASSGTNAQNSPANYPLVQIISLVNEQSGFLPVASDHPWSDTCFTSMPVSGFNPGWARVTVFANGIPSESKIILLCGSSGPVTLSCAADPFPPDGATGVSATPSLSWDPVNGATSYDVYFGTTSDPVFAVNTSSTSYNPGTLSQDNTYYWQIVPKNDETTAAGCPVWSFRACSPLPAPGMPNYTSIGSGSLTINWDPVDGGASNSITVISGAETLAAALGSGEPPADILAKLDTPDVSGLTFEPVLVGAYGTYTPVPPGAPADTMIINIPPGDGENGYYKATFELPEGFAEKALNGSANVDDYGRIFLNGHPITPSIVSGDPGTIDEMNSKTFSTQDPSYFVAGENTILISDANTGGGPSGTAFFITIGGQPVMYDLYRITGQCDVGTLIAANLSDTSYTDTGLNCGTQYSYYVVAKNADCSSANGACSSVTTLGAPGCAAVPDPADGALDVPLEPTFSWDPVSGADSYDVYFGTTASPPFAGNTSSNYFAPGTLERDTVYYWMVIPRSSCGSASGCGVWSFTTTGASCSISCAATVPSSIGLNIPATFQSTASADPSGCAVPAFDWDFGDNSAHSAEQNPTHSYAAAGDYNWILTVSGAPSLSCVKTGSINVSPCLLSISPSELPGGTVGAVYNQSVSAGGGTEPYTFTVSSGGLPGGFALSAEGILSGTPAAEGTFNFTITATDAMACSGSREYSLAVSSGGCAYALLPSNKNFTYKAASVKIRVTASGKDSCEPPGLSVSDAWVTAVLVKFSTNKGKVKVAVEKNPSATPRSAQVMIGGSLFPVTQNGAPCKVTAVSPKKIIVPAAGGGYSAAVTATMGDCGWTASPNGDAGSWIFMTSASGSGPGTVSFNVSPNTTGKKRTGTISVAGAAGKKNITIKQEAGGSSGNTFAGSYACQVTTVTPAGTTSGSGTFSVDSNGKVCDPNCTFTGTVESPSGNFTGTTIVCQGCSQMGMEGTFVLTGNFTISGSSATGAVSQTIVAHKI